MPDKSEVIPFSEEKRRTHKNSLPPMSDEVVHMEDFRKRSQDVLSLDDHRKITYLSNAGEYMKKLSHMLYHQEINTDEVNDYYRHLIGMNVEELAELMLGQTIRKALADPSYFEALKLAFTHQLTKFRNSLMNK